MKDSQSPLKQLHTCLPRSLSTERAGNYRNHSSKTQWHALLLLALFSCSIQKNNVPVQPVYQTESLLIYQLTANAFQHVSYKQTNDFGLVACNGLVVRNGREAIVFDTPVNDASAEELIKWIEGTLACTVKAVVPTHFHDDCLGGLQAFHNHGIPSYAHVKTLALAKENNFTVPQHAFHDSLRLPVGSTLATVNYYGEGHTPDNVVGYFPSESILFGGCMIRALGASQGYLGDAKVAEWAHTVEKVKQAYPDVQMVVPGHGAHGTKDLLDYTIKLYRTKKPGEGK